MDVTNNAEVEAGIAQTMRTFGRLDILVNNAGVTRDALLPRMTDEPWVDVIQTNLNGTFQSSWAATKYVTGITIDETTGAITVTYDTTANGIPQLGADNTIILTPTIAGAAISPAVTGNMDWDCKQGSVLPKYRPSQCRV